MSNSVETLLRNNQRAASVLVGLASLPILIGAVVAALSWHRQPLLVVGGLLVAVWGASQLVRQLVWRQLPRMAVCEGQLLLYVLGWRPYRVPLDVVECFFIGQAPSRVKVRHPAGDRVENVTVVVRLAERAADWHRQPVHPALARWCDGYVTLLGDWCEPLNGDVVNGLNHRLAAIKRETRSA